MIAIIKHPNMQNFFLTCIFYLQNSLFVFKSQGYIKIYLSLFFSIYLIIQSLYKLYLYFYDYFSWSYLVIGIGLCLYTLYQAFKPAYHKHVSLKKNFKYESITDFYAKNR